MPSGDSKPAAVLVIGPTAVGKSWTALQLARKWDGEIISMDSRLLYRGMDIGTDKPSLDVRFEIPHHLIDVADPDEIWSLADYQAAALRAVEEITVEGRLPILVGGTGQYVRALIEGWHIPRQEPDRALRQELEEFASQEGTDVLLAALEAVDPEALDIIDPHNTRRVIRALEVVLQTGEPFSSQRTRNEPSIRPLLIGLQRPRPELYLRIDQRIDDMMERGFVDEVRRLLGLGYSADLPSFTAIGYREVVDYLRGEVTLDDAVILMKRRSRQLVRRQANWFKRDDPNISWFSVTGNAFDDINGRIAKFLEVEKA